MVILLPEQGTKSDKPRKADSYKPDTASIGMLQGGQVPNENRVTGDYKSDTASIGKLQESVHVQKKSEGKNERAREKG